MIHHCPKLEPTGRIHPSHWDPAARGKRTILTLLLFLSWALPPAEAALLPADMISRRMMGVSA